MTIFRIDRLRALPVVGRRQMLAPAVLTPPI